MTKTEGSVIAGGQRPHDRPACVLVAPGGGGQREEPLKHADDHTAGGPAAVPFEVELTLEDLVDRHDDLPQRWLWPRPRTAPPGAAGPGRSSSSPRARWTGRLPWWPGSAPCRAWP